MRQLTESGIEWIGKIPAEWQTIRLKYLLNERNVRTAAGDETLLSVSVHSGVVPSSELRQRTMQADSLVGYKVVHKGDMVFNKLNPNLARFGYSDYDGITSPDFAVYYPKEPARIDMRFLAYLIRTPMYVERIKQLTSGVGEGFARLYTDELFGITIGVPTLQEQQQIADYLDERCGAIDVVKKSIEDEVEALRRLRRATIHNAVTKGLDDGISIQESGIDWVPTIPAGWNVMPYKHVFREIERPARDDDEIITCFRDGEVTLRKNRREDGFTIAEQESGYQHISRGDLVVHGMDGFAGSIGISDSDGKATPVLIVLNPLHDECPGYFMYQLRAYAYLEVFLATSTGIRVRSCSLNWKKLGSLPAIVPPSDEQQRIADYLDEQCAAIDSIIDARTRQLERLEDYRKALIYAYATGKKEVPAS